MTKAQWRSNRSKTTSWTSFCFSGKVTVKVTKLQRTFSTCRILPSSYRIKARIAGNAVTFELDKPRKVAVEFDNDITHPMLVFAEELEQNIPDQNNTNVVYFAPGVHDIGDAYSISSNKTVYLAGGAYVKGKFKSNYANNIKIMGRGILSGEQYAHKTGHMIRFRECRNVLIEGITIINSPEFNISLRGSNHTVRNVKMIGW